MDRLIQSEEDLLGLGRKENVSPGDSLSQCPDRDHQASKISVLTIEILNNSACHDSMLPRKLTFVSILSFFGARDYP